MKNCNFVCTYESQIVFLYIYLVLIYYRLIILVYSVFYNTRIALSSYLCFFLIFSILNTVFSKVVTVVYCIILGHVWTSCACF